MATFIPAPTVFPAPNFNAEADSQTLRKAMKGFGTDEAAIIRVLSKRTSNQRSEIEKRYKALFGRDLLEDLKKELGGKFEDAVLALMTPVMDLLAKQAHKAMSGLGTDDDDLIEIVGSLNNSHLRELKASYERLYGKSLEDALKGETSGHFKKLLVFLIQGQRDESSNVDNKKAQEDAQALIDAGEKHWGTEESVFITVLANRSFPQLLAMFDAFQKLTNKTVEQVLDAELSGDILMGLKSLVKVTRNTPAFFAERLYKAMKGLGTDDRTVIRIIISRSEFDLKLIKQEYLKMYGKTLDHDISGDTSGDYKKLLLAILDE